MVQLLESLGDEFRMRAAGLDGFNEGAARAFAEAAERVDQALHTYLSERLTITKAAAEFGWNYEALRQRLGRNPELRCGINGRPAVTRQVMREQIGRGRGPRGKEGHTAPKAPSVDLDPDLRTALARLRKRSVGERI